MLRSSVTIPKNLVLAIREAASFGASDREIATACGRSIAEVRSVQDRVRTADEFKAALQLNSRLKAPRKTIASLAWDVEQISKAIDYQLLGKFQRPVQMARRMGRNYAIFTARQNRVAPSSAVAIILEPVSERNNQAKAVANAAKKHVIAPRSELKGIHQTLVDHGIAIGFVRQGTNKDGSVVTATLEEWPLEFVQWDESRRQLTTRIDREPDEVITHGDSNWIVFRRMQNDPWARDACLIPAGLIWAAHTEGISSWAGSARAHGQSRMVGQLPEGVTLAREDQTLSPEAAAFRDLLTRLASGEDSAGILPPGATAEFLSDESTAWQVFDALATNQEKAASRIYLGTDASLGSAGGAPGVDISMLFGVATTLVQGDFEAIEQALNVGLYQPWTAINYGDSKFAPRANYQLPDPDAERVREEREKNHKRFTDAIASYRAVGLVVDQDVVKHLAKEYGVKVPTLASQSRVPLTLAPTDVARVVRVNEACASQGLPNLDDKRGTLFLSELEAEAESEAKADADIEVAEAEPTEPTALAP